MKKWFWRISLAIGLCLSSGCKYLPEVTWIGTSQEVEGVFNPYIWEGPIQDPPCFTDYFGLWNTWGVEHNVWLEMGIGYLSAFQPLAANQIDTEAKLTHDLGWQSVAGPIPTWFKAILNPNPNYPYYIFNFVGYKQWTVGNVTYFISLAPDFYGPLVRIDSGWWDTVGNVCFNTWRQQVLICDHLMGTDDQWCYLPQTSTAGPHTPRPEAP